MTVEVDRKSEGESGLFTADGRRLAGEHHHRASSYEDYRAQAAFIADFVLEASRDDDSVTLIVTQAHRNAIFDKLRSHGFEETGVWANSRLKVLDAHELLGNILVGSKPERARFRSLICPLLVEASAGPKSRHLRIYAELIDLLAASNPSSALFLEELWDELHQEWPFQLLCGYAASSFGEQGSELERLSAVHESTVALPEGEREPSVQGGARALRGEVAEREGSTGSRTERLMRITAAIAHAVTHEEVVEAVVDQVAVSLGASSAALWLLEQSGEGLTLVRSLGYREQAKQSISSLSLDTAVRLPVLDAVRSSAPIWLNSQAELILEYPELAALVTPGRSYRVCCLPLLAQDRALGALAFTFDGVQPFEASERDFFMLVARYAGQAIERLRLLNSERQARADAEASAARLQLLGRTSHEFSKAERSLPAVLQTCVEQVTEEYADMASIFLLGNENAPLELAAVHHRIPEAARLIRSVLEARPVRMGEGFSGQVAATGVPIRLTDANPDLLLRYAPVELRETLARFVPHSILLVPMKTRGQVIGTLGVARQVPAPAFSSSDQYFLEELAERAATAIETRRLNEENAHGRLRAELLYDMAGAVIRADHLEDVFEAALDALERALGTARSAILAFDPEGVMRFRASRGISEAYRRAVEGHSPWQREERYPDPVLVPDVMKDPELCAYRSVFELENIRALAFIPLSTGRRLLGKFMVYYDKPRELSRSELDMAVACGNHVAAAMARYSALAELEQTVRFNEIFTGILGHDLRNPLGAILTAAEVALKRAEGEKVTKPLARIISSGTRMARMIDQLLDFTRVRVGSGIPVVPERVDLLGLLQHVMDELEGTYPGRMRSPEVLGHDVHGVWDADRLSQVFSNLIANALRHGREETAVTVRVDARDASSVRIDVHNHGVIPPALFPSLFEPMAGGKRQISSAQGLGLGLYISREIMKAHGGQILVRSSEPEGTTFSVVLPRIAVVPVSLERKLE